ncbi:protein transport protein sec31-like [Triticum aestivum]|uniref:protein transport protein sec31-like n=1 Tax=Triticum aestivum TaxID=4565 RepID=UPI001D00649E|nr:protein transport protein sec31-like [Triticum aestivum]
MRLILSQPRDQTSPINAPGAPLPQSPSGFSPCHSHCSPRNLDLARAEPPPHRFRCRSRRSSQTNNHEPPEFAQLTGDPPPSLCPVPTSSTHTTTPTGVTTPRRISPAASPTPETAVASVPPSPDGRAGVPCSSLMPLPRYCPKCEANYYDSLELNHQYQGMSTTRKSYVVGLRSTLNLLLVLMGLHTLMIGFICVI